MQNRKQEASTKWGVKGLEFGALLGGGAGALMYRSDKYDWERYKQVCFKLHETPNAYLRPRLTYSCALPLMTTAAFMGGLGYVSGKVYEKMRPPTEQFIPNRSEKWANNGLKVGTAVGFGIACVLNRIVPVHSSELLKAYAKPSIVGGLMCAGVGLFAGTVAKKFKDDTHIKTLVPKL